MRLPCINGYFTYRHYLIVTNYTDGSMTLKQFVDIARKYVDTAKSDKPISSIIFVGKGRWTTLPKADWDHFEQQKKYFIVTIGFDNSFIDNRDKKNKEVDFIKIGGYGNKDYDTKKEVDSVLSVDALLITGF